MAILATFSDAITLTAIFDAAGQKDLREQCAVGVKIRANCGQDGYKFGEVVGVSYSDPITTIQIMGDALTANLTSFDHSNDTPDSLPLHSHPYASPGTAGPVMLGTGEQVQAGVDERVAVTPAALRAGLIGSDASQVSTNAMLGTGAFQDLRFVDVSFEYAPPPLAGGAMATKTGIAVSEAEFGDFVFVSASQPLQGVIANGYVSDANLCDVMLYNCKGSTVNLASGVWNIRLMKLIPMRDE
jgi:hypothetical protein